jgi:hypothetical protein
MAAILACKGCGRTKDGPTGDPTDLFPAEHCDQCPPWRCADCGEMDSFAARCRCWVSLEGMALADIKAIFAGDGTFSVGGLGSGEA